MDTRGQFKDGQATISDQKDEVLEDVSLSEISFASDVDRLGSKEVDDSSGGTGDSRTTLLSNDSGIECEKESTGDCSCAESEFSGNKGGSDEYRCPLRLRLHLPREGGECSKQTEGVQEGSNVSGNDHEERVVARNVGKEGTVDSQARDSSGESKLSASRSSSRYSLRVRPEPRRRYQIEQVQKVIKRKSPTRKRLRKKKEEEESDEEERKEEERVEERKDEEEVEDDIEETNGARIDFVYRRDERTYVRPGLSLPLFKSGGFAAYIVQDEMNLRTPRIELILKQSEIHGAGLFTKGRIINGRRILEFVGEYIRKVIADLREKRYEELGMGSCYMFRVNDEYVIDATMKGWIGRYINHCCSPNCEAKTKGRRIFMYALRDIQEKEEITLDYGDDGHSARRSCNCGSATCCGIRAV